MEKVFEYNQHFVAMMNIINAARLNPPDKGHKHHIIPKCWFIENGLDVDNSSKNLVLLSKEDHAKIHKLASLCIKGSKFKTYMSFAAHMMGQPVTNFNYVMSEETRKKLSLAFKGRKLSNEAKLKMAAAKKGKKPANWENLIKSNKGKKRSAEFRERMHQTHIGKKFTPEHTRNSARAHIKTEFGLKFFDHYGFISENPKLFKTEQQFYNLNGYCSWEK